MVKLEPVSSRSIITCNVINMDANKVAHNLARHAFDSDFVIVWDGDPPTFIMPAVIADVTIPTI